MAESKCECGNPAEFVMGIEIEEGGEETFRPVCQSCAERFIRGLRRANAIVRERYEEESSDDMPATTGNNPPTEVTIITDTPAATCELCGEEKELRPYGPNGENICFDCGQKDKAATQRMMEHSMIREGE